MITILLLDSKINMIDAKCFKNMNLILINFLGPLQGIFNILNILINYFVETNIFMNRQKLKTNGLDISFPPINI